MSIDELCEVVSCAKAWSIAPAGGGHVCLEHAVAVGVVDNCDSCTGLASVKVGNERYCGKCFVLFTDEQADVVEACEQDGCFDIATKFAQRDRETSDQIFFCAAHGNMLEAAIAKDGYTMYELDWPDDSKSVNQAALAEIDKRGLSKQGAATPGYSSALKPYDWRGDSQLTYKQCYHDGTSVVFKSSDGISLAGGRGANVEPYTADLVVDLAGMFKLPEFAWVAMADQPWAGLNALTNRMCKRVRFNWEDRTVPPVPLAFWKEVWRIIRQEGHKRVVFCCVGGHGRTGTALASMIVTESGMKPSKVIAMVRKLHCEKAVETTGQEEYVKGLGK